MPNIELRELNPIEQAFLDSYKRSLEEGGVQTTFDLIPQCKIGPYLVDFSFSWCLIEIDGYEYHKTKEQREYDYKRERYFLRQGYCVIRFTGTEVFLDSDGCVKEMLEIANLVERNKQAELRGNKLVFEVKAGTEG